MLIVSKATPQHTNKNSNWGEGVFILFNEVDNVADKMVDK